MKGSDRRCAWAGLVGPVLAALAMTGCGDRTYPVEGQVNFKGEGPARELAGFTVDFELDSDEKKAGATGVIKEDGTFTVGTHKGNDGALLGKHRVALSPPVADDDHPRVRSPIPDHYGSFQNSGLEVEIKAERNKVVLEVERK